MISSRKGNTDLLFKWMFGIIAGAIILTFFIRFSYVHISGESLIEGNRILLTVENKLDSFGVREGTDVFDIKDDFLLGFDCGLITSGDMIEDNFFERKMDKIIFAPEIINDRYISMWTKKWEVPYGIATFYYLKDKGSNILLVGQTGSDEYSDFIGRIPSTMNVIFANNPFNPADYTSMARQSNKFTVVYFGNAPYSWDELNAEYGNFMDLEVIIVNMANHEAEVYDSNGVMEQVFYLGDEMLYGLIFSGSKFACTKDIAMGRFNVLTRIYLEKVSKIIGKENRDKCRDMLVEARTILSNYQNEITNPELYTSLEKLEKQNLQLEREACPTVY